jgi:hypothetical protein
VLPELSLSARQVSELLAERGIDVSARTVLTGAHTFGPQIAPAARPRRRRLAQPWRVDEVVPLSRHGKALPLPAVDEHGQVVDVLLRDRRDIVSAEALFRQAIARSGKGPGHWRQRPPPAVYMKRVQHAVGSAQHVRTGLHRRRGETTKPIERSHVADGIGCEHPAG